MAFLLHQGRLDRLATPHHGSMVAFVHNNLVQRVLTAAVGLPLVLGLFLRGDVPIVRSVFAFLTCLTAFEIGKLALSTRATPSYVVASVLVSALGFWSLSRPDAEADARILVLFMLAAILIGAFGRGTVGDRAARAQGLLFTIAYSIVTWVACWDLFRQARPLLFLTLAIAWGSDTCAYFVGRAFGKHALAPTVSPKKTWEGALGGFTGSLVAVAAFLVLNAESEVSVVPLSLLAPVCAVAAQLGDLLKSVFKRNAGVKDAGKILPGHGGLIDRVDSVLLVALVLWLALPMLMT